MTPALIEAGLLSLERLRGEIDDAVLDVALGALRERLLALQAADQGEQPEQRLSQVTVLFVDVVGSTALGGKLEPEDIHLVMDTALERFTAIVERHKGRVLQYAGDSLLAAFGTQGVHEDDTENAVLAGLGIVGETRVQAERVKREHGHPGFNVRVGLHTGPVLLGAGVDAANSIRGATVNLAARMEQSAPPGSVRISATTQRLVAGQFEVIEQPPLVVKGHAEPLRTFLVQRRLRGMASALRGVAGLQTPLLGRQPALLALQQAWQRLHSSPAALAAGVETLLLLGEAGLGKSRVLQHWQAWALAQPARALWLQAQARPQQARVPYALLRELLCDALALPDTDTPAQARERFGASVVPWLQALPGLDEHPDAALAEAHVLGHLLGLNFSDSPFVRGILQQGNQIRQRGLHTAAVLLAQWAAHRGLPLLLCLDDVHWADDASLDFLRSLPERGLNLPVLLLLATRPVLEERRPDWATTQAQRVLLSPLSPHDSQALAQALLAPLQPAAPALQDLLVQRAGGNPFFMEELLHLLLEQGVIVSTPRSDTAPGALCWTLQTTALQHHPVPASLNGVLQARLSALPPAERLALQQAAVLGPVFWQPSLQALDPGAPLQLPALCARALLQARSHLAADAQAEFAFAHLLLQQVAYQRLLRPERQALHGHAGRWYAGMSTARAADYLGVAAEHFESAALWPETVHFSLLAAQDLAQRFAHEGVVEHSTRGLAHARADDLSTRWQLLLLRQRALRLSGQSEAQGLDLQALAELAARSQQPLHLATVAVRQAVAADETGHPQEAAALAPAALAAAQHAGDTALELGAYNLWAASLRSTGAHDEAREVVEKALLRARECQDDAAHSELLVTAAAIATEQGRASASTHLLRQALHMQRSQGDKARECVSRINLGAAALQLGDFDGAEADLKDALRLSRVIGNRMLELSTLINLASTRLPLLRVAEAAADAEAAVLLARAVSNPEYEAFAHLTRGSVLLAQGDCSAAEAAFSLSHHMLGELGLAHLGIEAVAWRARVRLQAGQAEAAALDTEAVLAHWAEHGHFNGTEKPHLIRLICCEVLLHLNDARAPAVLAQSWQAFKQHTESIGDPAQRAQFEAGHGHHRALQRLVQAAGLA